MFHMRLIDKKNRVYSINRIWNILADKCNHDVFGYIGDDMIFKTPGWDTRVLNEFSTENCPEDKIKMVHCNDGFRGHEISVNAFVHRKYYDVLGYFTRPEFLCAPRRNLHKCIISCIFKSVKPFVSDFHTRNLW